MDNLDSWLERTLDGKKEVSNENSNSNKGLTRPQGQQQRQQQGNRPPAPVQNRPAQARPMQSARPGQAQPQRKPQGFSPRPKNQQQARPQGQPGRPQPTGQRSQQPRPQQPQGRLGTLQGPSQPAARPQQGQARPPQQPKPTNKNRPQPQRSQKPPRPQKMQGRPQPARQRKPKAPGPLQHPMAEVKSKHPIQVHKSKLRIIPIGGLNEVGKNMTVLEYEDDIIIIDAGLEFPSEDMLGIDYVIPDVSYLQERKDRIRGIVITHGHLDHIGGLPYILPKLDFPPVYATKLTVGLIQKRNEEFNLEKIAKVITISPDDIIKLGKFTCSFFRVMHSIPDCVAVVAECPEGKVVHTGDFKFDDTPARNIQPAEIHKMEALGSQNVLALLCESTNALKPGHSMSEKAVGDTLEDIIKATPGRLIIASFSSQVGRLQQIIDASIKHGRQLFVSGRSMIDNIEIAYKLGYIQMPQGYLKDLRQYKAGKVPDSEALIITTGSQGEDISALSRMAGGEHQHLKVKKNDTIVLASSPIIGNEIAINTVINKLCILGAEVIHNQIRDVHTSGHGKMDELERMIKYVKPKYLIPIHGEYYMRQGLMKIAMERCGFTEDRVILCQNGDVTEATQGICSLAKDKAEAKYVLIDGRGEGRMDSAVQSDREILSQNGALIVLVYINRKTRRLSRDPEITSRGFMYMHESNEIIQDIINIAGNAYNRIMDKNSGANRGEIKKYIQQTIDDFANRELARRPLVVPLIIED